MPNNLSSDKTFSHKKEIIILCSIILISILSRGLTLLTPNMRPDPIPDGLMGLRVLNGDFPVLYMAQNYMGSMEAYLTGSFFLFFGSSHLTLDLLAFIFSIWFLIFLYLLSKTFFGYKTALISIALLAIPPWFLTAWSHEARLFYHLPIIFGNFLLLISYKAIYPQDVRPERERILFVLIGLLSGIGWWTNFLVIAYLIPIGLFIFLRDKKILFNKNILFLLFPFLLGSSPLWTFNVIHNFPIPFLLGSPPPSDNAINVIHDFSITGLVGLWDVFHSLSYIKDFFMNAFPFIIGFVPPLNKDKMDLTGYLIIGPIYLIALIYFIYKSRPSLKSFFLLRLTKTPSGEILVFLFFVNIFLNLFTPYGRFLSRDDQRYLLPLYTCLPIFVSVFLQDISKKYQILSLFLLGLILLSNVSGNLRQEDAWLVFNSDKFLAAKKNLAMENRITAFLINNGYTRIYSFIDSRWRKGITFNSQGAIICAHPSLEAYPKYADLVDASSKVSFLSLGEDKVLEENLKAIGGSYRKVTAPDGYLLYTDFKPPQTAYRTIPRHLWRGSSNLYSSEAQNAFDGDVSTGWSTRGPQKKGTYFLLDLGQVETVGKVSWIPAIFSHVPTGYQVSVSLDGKNWQIVINLPEYNGPIFWSGPHPMIKVRNGMVETVFSPHPCRFLKISLLRDSDISHWSINELFLFSPDGDKGNKGNPAIREHDIDRLLSFLREQKINFVYTNQWISAAIRVKSNWKMETVISNFFTGDNGEMAPDPEIINFTGIHFNRNVALVVDKQEDKGLEKIWLESHPYSRQTNLGPFVVYYGFPGSKDRALPIKNWYVTANANPQEAEKAIDGNQTTRWSSGMPQWPGIFYQVDLKTIQLVKGFTLSWGESFNDYPRSLKVLYSLDGNSWKEIKTPTEPVLYWTGETILILRGEKKRYFFSPLRLRYLRLLQEGQDPVYWWSINELEVFGNKL